MFGRLRRPPRLSRRLSFMVTDRGEEAITESSKPPMRVLMAIRSSGSGDISHLAGVSGLSEEQTEKALRALLRQGLIMKTENEPDERGY